MIFGIKIIRSIKLKRRCSVNCVSAVNRKENVLVSAEAYAEAASAVPDVIACVIVHPVGDGEGNTVEEHITAKALVRLA